MTSFTRTWNGSYEADPADSEDAKLGAQRIRQGRVDVRERLDVDHSWAGDTHDGKHDKVTLRVLGADPTLDDANEMALYAKLFVGVARLYTKIGATVTLFDFPTGAQADYWGTSAPTGWVMAAGRTLGDATSGATERANADTQTLYELLWNSIADAECPVSSGRGASATADFGAHKTITLPDCRGRTVAGKDNMGGTTASRLTATTVLGTTLGKAGGAETQTLSIAQMPSHTHNIGTGITDLDQTRIGGGRVALIQNILTESTGGGGAHENVQPTIIANKIIKL